MKEITQVGEADLDYADSRADVQFTRRQYEYLNRVFGETVGGSEITDADLRINQGRRSVVHHVKGLIR